VKCPDCGKTGIKKSSLQFHRAGHNRWKNHKPNGSGGGGNGHADLTTMREHGKKYLAARRETLLAAIDEIDAAMKTLEL
jgi:hypothetical protein